MLASVPALQTRTGTDALRGRTLSSLSEGDQRSRMGGAETAASLSFAPLSLHTCVYPHCQQAGGWCVLGLGVCEQSELLCDEDDA